MCTVHGESLYLPMEPVRIRHSSHEIATQLSHSVDRAGRQAKNGVY